MELLALLGLGLVGALFPGGGSSGGTDDDTDADPQRQASPSDNAAVSGEQSTGDLLDDFARVDQAGGPGADTLQGRGNDVVRGRSGDDSLTGYGDAEVWGGMGDDSIEVFSDGFGSDNAPVGHGGQGNDTMHGAGYGTRLQGDRGDDTLRIEQDAFGNGGRGDDTLRVTDFGRGLGGRGSDMIFAWDESKAYGGAGRDYIAASSAVAVYGGQGDDWISVSGDSYPPHGETTQAFGGKGDDLFFMSDGAIVTGGEGADSFAVLVDDVVDEDEFPISSVSITDFEQGTDRILVNVDQPIASFTLTEVAGGTLARIETVPVGEGPQIEGVEIYIQGVTGLTRDDFELVETVSGSFARGPDFGLKLGAISPA